MTKTSTKGPSANIPRPLTDKVGQMSQGRERSPSSITHPALPARIAQEQRRDRLTQEALADVDAGLLVDHWAVQAWADSLGTEKALPLPNG
jgi:predicted transcriptional regulator